MVDLNASQFEHLHDLTWDEVFDIWRQNEADNLHWQEHAKSRGFANWEEWRKATHAPLRPETLEWRLYRVLDPLASIPQFRGGPFKSWKRVHYGERDSMTFAELAQLPAIQENGSVLSLLSDFPAQTTITAVQTGDAIWTVEGMHRCCAIVVAAQQGKQLSTDLQMAIASYPGDTLPGLGVG